MLFSLALALAQPQGPLAGNVPMISPALPNANTDILDTVVEVCGYVVPSANPTEESMLFGGGGFLLVEDGVHPPLRIGSITCVVGVVRRRDGISRQETIARGIGFPHLSHGVNSSYVLRRCFDRAGCDALIPRWLPKAEEGRPD